MQAIEKITGQADIVPYGCGRTDAGVHANGQVCHFDIDCTAKLNAFKSGINRFTPRSISINKAEEVAEDFHARFSCIERAYTYLIYNRKEPSPLWLNKAGHIRYNLDFELMKSVAVPLLGENDFSGFRSSFCQSGTPMCNLSQVSIEHIPYQNLIAVHVKGDHFLHNMIRIIVGTLVDIGRGHLPPETIEELLHHKNRTKAGLTSPPCGLYFKAASFKDHKIIESC